MVKFFFTIVFGSLADTVLILYSDTIDSSSWNTQCIDKESVFVSPFFYLQV